MKVKIIKLYSDTTMGGELVKEGTELEVTEERGKVLINAGVAEEIKGVRTSKSSAKKADKK